MVTMCTKLDLLTKSYSDICCTVNLTLITPAVVLKCICYVLVVHFLNKLGLINVFYTLLVVARFQAFGYLYIGTYTIVH